MNRLSVCFKAEQTFNFVSWGKKLELLILLRYRRENVFKVERENPENQVNIKLKAHRVIGRDNIKSKLQ
jgi:hypothetical protein